MVQIFPKLLQETCWKTASNHKLSQKTPKLLKNANNEDLLENVESKEQNHEHQDHGAHHNDHNAMKGVFKVRLGITDQCTAVTALHMCQVFGQADMVRVPVHCGTVFNLFHPWRSWRWRKIKLWWWSTALTVPKHGLIRK